MSAHAKRLPGALVVSLDVDLDTALRDRSTEVIERTLDLLAEREIHATWALVGLERAGLGIGEMIEMIELVAMITARPHQEIGTQTYACYHSDEPGPSAAQLDADLSAAVAIAAQHAVEVRSLVFPRSQCRAEYLPILARHGIRSYRGRRRGWAHAHSNSSIMTAVRRGLCLADNFSLLIPDAATSIASIVEQPRGQPINIPVSRFVRPYDPQHRQLEPLRVHRMQSEMITAAERGWVYHLWLRPQELGAHTYENLVVLDNLLRNARALAGRADFRSLMMSELDELANQRRQSTPQPADPR